MSLKSDKFYRYCAASCLLMVLFVKGARTNYWDENQALDVVLGSSPSFLYLLGIIALVPIAKKGIKYSSFIKVAICMTMGALAYEFEQYWT